MVSVCVVAIVHRTGRVEYSHDACNFVVYRFGIRKNTQNNSRSDLRHTYIENSQQTRLCEAHSRSPQLASYPGLLTPTLVACSTNVGEGLVNLITCSDVPGHWVDVRTVEE